MQRWLVLLALLLPLASAHDQGVGFDPAAEAGLFPTAAEIQGALERAAQVDGVTLYQVGASQQGVPIQVLEVLSLTSATPVEERAVTLLETQQHGNEPAGTPAALRLMDRLVDGTFDWDLLENQILLILPQSNPDGSALNQRGNVDGVDINRDHIGLETPEAQALATVLRQWNVHVAVDHHEYSGTGLGSPVPVRSYDWDLTTMYPNHGNVRPEIQQQALRLNDEYLKPAAEAEGYTVGDYGILTVGGVPVQQTAGGPDPGILRNKFGLEHVVGLLAESFVSPLETPFQSFERRVHGHEILMDATLQFTADHYEELVATKAAAMSTYETEPYDRYIEGEIVSFLPQGYVIEDSQLGLLELHGLADVFRINGDLVVPAQQPKAGLTAALFHEDSTRSVASTHYESEVPEVQHEDHGGTTESEDAPLPALIGLLGVLGAAVVRRRR